MIGGGRGAFIGAVHRIAAHMDGQAELVAGAFSSDPKRAKASAKDLYVSPDRAYGSYAEMAKAEAKMPADKRLDFVVIVTPNHQHFPPAKLFLESGFNVVEYPQGWLTSFVESTDNKQAEWRTDPKRSGAAGCMGDIGTHAENLARYITDLEIDTLCADLTTFVKGRKLDDDGNVLVRYKGGAKGILHSSQISIGDENMLNIRVYGTKAGIEWRQEFPNELVVKYADKPRETWRRGNDYLSPSVAPFTRIPAGHPEGYLEAFANIYLEAFRAIEAEVSGKKQPKNLDFPTIEDGVYGMAFIETVVKSSKLGAKWIKFPKA